MRNITDPKVKEEIKKAAKENNINFKDFESWSWKPSPVVMKGELEELEDEPVRVAERSIPGENDEKVVDRKKFLFPTILTTITNTVKTTTTTTSTIISM